MPQVSRDAHNLLAWRVERLVVPRVLLFAAAALAIGSTSSCRREAGPARADGTMSVFVSIPPQAYFVERIGGKHVNVEVLVGPGQSPHTFEPTLKQMGRLSASRLYFRIGVPFESTLCHKLAGASPQVVIVDTGKGIDRNRVHHTHEGHEGHEAGHDGEDHEGHLEPDPHIWLSPRLVKVQAQAICDALCQVDDANSIEYRKNLAAFHAELDGLDARIAAALAPLKGRTFYVFHPAFGYFAQAYSLHQQAVEIGGKSPPMRQVERLIADAKAAGVRVIFVQPQFSKALAETIASQIDGAVVPMDPLARDYVANLEDMAAKIKKALDRPKP